jgi:hypothetical protein
MRTLFRSRTFVALAIVCLTSASGTSAGAQIPARRDSVARDSVPRDSVQAAPIDAWGLVPVLAGMAASLVFAPAPIALFGGDSGATNMAFAHDHLDVSTSGGGIFSDGQTYARSANVQIVHSGRYAEAEAERIDGVRRQTYVAARVGALFSPRRNYMGGVTIGYQHVREDRRQRGPELGLPLFIGGQRAELRLDPTYVFAPGRVLWSVRSQFQARLGGTPFFAGARLAFRSAYHITKDVQYFTSGSVAALVGVRL